MKKVIPFHSADRELMGGIAIAPTRSNVGVARDLDFAGNGPEQQLLLLQRIIGCTEQGMLLNRFFRWTRDLNLADGLTFEAHSSSEPVVLGEKRHHSAQYDLNLDGIPLGKLSLCRRERYSEDELITIEQALGSVARCLRSALEASTLRELVTQDSLTGLGNRTALHEWMDREISRARRHGTPLSVMMIDVDHFKRLNDKLGHLGGDQVLRTIAKVFKESTRKSDLLFRFGGDEFTILLPHTDQAGAQEAARQIRVNLAKLRPEEYGLGDAIENVLPGLSIGIACHQSGDDEDCLLQRADTHLYHAKAQGRGRVCTSV